jgi:hypothetical protein
VKLSTEAAMTGVEATLMVAWELTGEGKERRGRRRGRRGGAWGGGSWEGEAKGGGWTKGRHWGCSARGLLCSVREEASLSCVREKENWERKEKEKERRKEKKKRKKRKKIRKIF